MNKKKLAIILFLSILISFLSGLSSSEEIFLTDSKNLIMALLTLLGLCFSGVSYVSVSINNIIKDKRGNKKINDISNSLMKNVEDDILLLLYLIIIIVLCNLFLYIDMPFISNPTNINFNLFKINSLKMFFYNFISSLSFCLSIYSFYDIIKATFKLIKIENIKN